MKFQILFSRKYKENIIYLSPSELAQGVVKVKEQCNICYQSFIMSFWKKKIFEKENDLFFVYLYKTL